MNDRLQNRVRAFFHLLQSECDLGRLHLCVASYTDVINSNLSSSLARLEFNSNDLLKHTSKASFKSQHRTRKVHADAVGAVLLAFRRSFALFLQEQQG